MQHLTMKGPAPDQVARLWYDAASARVVAWAPRSTTTGDDLTYDVASDTWAAVGALEVQVASGETLRIRPPASVDRVVATVWSGIPTRLFDLDTGRVVDARWAVGRPLRLLRVAEMLRPVRRHSHRLRRAKRSRRRAIGGAFAYDAVAVDGTRLGDLARATWEANLMM
jgi:hypothetical protein